jgi:hypothetical protein
VKKLGPMMCLWLATVGCAFAQTASQGSGELQAAYFRSNQTLTYQNSLPDAPSARPLRPLTDREKFALFTEEARSPLTFVSAGVTAGFNSASGRVYGGGWNGFGKNYAVAVAEHETSSFFGQYLFPKLLSQDPRYHPSEKDGFWKRSTYAASRVLLTRNDAGQKTVNSSYLLGALVSTAVASCYRPPRYQGAGQTMADFGSTVGGDAGMNILKEFWPQLRNRIRPITPKRLRNLEDRLVGYQEPEPLVKKNN